MVATQLQLHGQPPDRINWHLHFREHCSSDDITDRIDLQLVERLFIPQMVRAWTFIWGNRFRINGSLFDDAPLESVAVMTF